ncbi:MAG: 50S ribosomal protein L35 [Patescibacteria group bacterium]
MTKLKTRKALLKRLKITGRHKILRRKVHQGHFNAKDSGQQTRKKRKSIMVSPANFKRIKKILPNI